MSFKRAAAGAHGALRLEEHETGTSVELRELRGARPFDRTFIDNDDRASRPGDRVGSVPRDPRDEGGEHMG